jgi:hypothetical protein
VSNPSVLFDLLPAEGDWLSRDAAHAALNDQVNKDLSDEDFDHCIWQLGQRVIWLPNERRLRRQIANGYGDLPEEVTCERDLEKWFERFAWSHAISLLYDPRPKSYSLIVQNTARGGIQSGRWTRPDVCLACISRYQYAPHPSLELFSFELKMPAGCNVYAVHEALSHTAAVHFAYLALYLPERSSDAEQLPAVLEEAQRHGVGVIRIFKPHDSSAYQRLLIARRYEPAPAKLDSFIEERFDLANRIALQKWVRK